MCPVLAPVLPLLGVALFVAFDNDYLPMIMFAGTVAVVALSSKYTGEVSVSGPLEGTIAEPFSSDYIGYYARSPRLATVILLLSRAAVLVLSVAFLSLVLASVWDLLTS